MAASHYAKSSVHQLLLNLTFLLSFFFSIPLFCVSQDTLLPNQSLPDGKFISSAAGTFEMGFFTPGGSPQRFFGIWYRIISQGTVVWVANRDSPLDTASGSLQLSLDGNLQVFNSTNATTASWSSNSSAAANPVAQLLESGNLVVKDDNGNYIWQSFEHPGHTALPGMRIGKNLATGLDWVLRSWKSDRDPGTGNFSFSIDSHGYPQLFIRESGVDKFRSGPWNEKSFTGAPGLRPNPIYTYDFVFNQSAIYYTFNLVNTLVFSRLVLSSTGVVQRFTWNNRTQVWTITINAPQDNCDYYGLCYGYGICDIGKNPVCSCLDRFKPSDQHGWDAADWSRGCVRETNLSCPSDGFIKYSGVKLPDTRRSWYNTSMNLDECRVMCLRNCSCMAYSSIETTERGSGCLLWFEDLMDMANFNENGQDIYIRMASSEIASMGRKSKILRICVGVLAAIVALGLVLVLCIWRKKRQKRQIQGSQKPTQKLGTTGHTQQMECGAEQGNLELPLFDLSTVLEATNNFSRDNKIGEGGFGPVYKGVVQGQEIAVKRQSKKSNQGLDEFKNEVILIAKLQHRNLVKLLGCCIEGHEKMLIYEYMPNSSLDKFIFNEDQRKMLDWPSRFHIINGIARGLLYLHQDSRLRIVHRDLKAGNVLLDDGMNPKISDFGMARSFGGNDTEGNTGRVVGTYGYMSPEYAVDGHFSVKSDVYSFGVLVLEIVSGNKNRGFSHPNHHHNLIGHAWILQNQARSLELIDPCLSVESSQLPEILRSIHVGLLCVQRLPEDRPNMSNVVLMLGSEGALPTPKEPGFFTERNFFSESSSSASMPMHTKSTGNEMSITIMEPR